MTDELWPTVPESLPPGLSDGTPPSQAFYAEESSHPGITQYMAAMRSGCEAIEAELRAKGLYGDPPSQAFRLEDVHITVFRQAVSGSVPYVVVRHDPTGVVAAADESPSQTRNERAALERLRKNVEQWRARGGQ